MNILSVQSEVVYGHVGQGAARFALQRLGHEVWALPTVLLSNHTGYSLAEGETIAAELIERLAAGLAANSLIESCDAVLSGYLGSVAQADALAEVVLRVKISNPRAVYCFDPVFGDDGRAYAKPGVAEAMARRLLPLAHIVTPNAFELASLTSVPVRDPSEALIAARRLARPVVAATSVPVGFDRVGVLVTDRHEAWLASTPRLAKVPHGAGDLFAALFLARRLEGLPLSEALARAVASVFHVLSNSHGNEMALIAEQDAILSPPDGIDFRIEAVN